MKKFLLVCAMLIAFVCAQAQKNPPIKQDKFFDETFVGVTIGANGMAKSGDWIGMNAGLRVGKWFTPQLGAEFEGLAQFNRFFKTIHSHRVGLNALVNLNYLAGYKGHRHDCEFVPFVGIGWQRNYDYYVNSMYTKMGVQVNINIDSRWQFNVIPSVSYVLSPGMQYDVRNMDYGIALGVTYNFKNSHGTHFFDVCDKKYTQTEMDNMNSRINCLLEDIKGLNEENASLRDSLSNIPTTTVIENTVETRDIIVLPPIQFLFNSATISPTSYAALYDIARVMIQNPEVNWNVIGYASNEGSDTYNLTLSGNRAKAVVRALVDYGANPDRIKVTAGGVSEEYFDPSLNRRVVVIPQ